MNVAEQTTIGIPVLLISYSGSHRLKSQLDALKFHSFTRIYVSFDGPRKGHEPDARFFEETQKSLDALCSDITVRTLAQNLGSAKHCLDAISWFLDQEEIGLIVEDDVQLARGLRISSDVAELFKPKTFAICLYGNKADDAVIAPFFAGWGWIGQRHAWKARLDYFTKNNADLKKINISSGNFLIDMYFRRWIKYNNSKPIKHWDIATQQYLFDAGLECIYTPTITQNTGFTQEATNTKSAPPNYFICSDDITVTLNSKLPVRRASQNEVNTITWTLHTFPYNLSTFMRRKLYGLAQKWRTLRSGRSIQSNAPKNRL